MVELSISPGLLDGDEIKPLLTFSPATVASEVILTGAGSDVFDPYYGMVVGGGRRLGHWMDAASVTKPSRAGYAQPHALEGGMAQGPCRYKSSAGSCAISTTGQGGTTFSGLPITVLGGNNAPTVQLSRMRFEKSGSDAPAILIHDLGRVVVQDCVFDQNAAGAIRMLSGSLEVTYSSFTSNGGHTIRGGALALMSGFAKITQSILDGNNASEGGAIYIEGAEVSLGNRTTLTNNRADLGSAGGTSANSFASDGGSTIYDGQGGRPKIYADSDKFYQDAGSNPSTPNYVASELHGNSIYCTNGTLRYILPAPLGHWVGPARETEVLPLGLIGTDVVSIVVKANNQVTYNPLDRRLADKRIELLSDFRIDEDYPYRCLPGYFREQDTPEAQDGPQCESVCRPGTWCPEGAATPFPCFTASYCPEGSEYPTPCPKGTWTNRTDLVSAWDCEPCPPGHYCPLNTSVPIECGEGTYAPTSGHFKCQLCPIGYFQEMLGQWNCSTCIEGFYCPLGTTIEPCFPGEYRNLSSGACEKAPLGHFAALGATYPTVCSAGSHADETGLLKCKLCPFGKYMESMQAIVCKPCMIYNYCPVGSTGGTVCKPGTVRMTEGAGSQDNCSDAPLGHFGLGGLPNPCPKGFYQDQLGTDSEQDCIRCPQYSTTFEVARTNVADCLCQNGFIESFDASGGRICQCDFGEGIVTSGGFDACEPCDYGRFKDFRGNVKCRECKNEYWTTAGIGSIPRSACVCKIGFYLAPVLSENDTYTGESSSIRSWELTATFPKRDPWTGVKKDLTMERYMDGLANDQALAEPWGGDCIRCEKTWEFRSDKSTNCTVIGLRLETLPIMPGFYRERNISRVVRGCNKGSAIPAACKGGTDVNDQCMISQTGPMCGICAKGYFASGDGLCAECTGDSTITIILPFVLFFTFIFTISFAYRKWGAHAKKMIMEKLPMGVDVLSGEDPADVWAAQLEKARQELGKEHPYTFGALAYMNRKAKSFGIRLKIILSLMQVMNGVSVCFELKFPPLFRGLLSWLGIITFVDIDLPKLMPMGCIFEVNYTSSLVSKTAVPALMIMGLYIAGFVASKLCAAKDAAEWDMDADGEIDRDEFMQAQPQGKFVSDLCNSIAFFMIFLLYPSATVATFQFFVCGKFQGEGESGYEYLMKDFRIDCEGALWYTWRYYIIGMIFIYPVGVPMFYITNLFINRHHLDRLRRFQIEQEDIEKEKKARRNTVSELTITEFERQELMRLLEEAEVERVAKKQDHLERTLPTVIKKLTNGYTWKCYWFEIFECVRKVLLIGIPVVFTPAGGIDQRVWGLIVCFLASISIAQLRPYAEPVDQQLAILCQFQVFFVVIAGAVLAEVPDSPLIDAVLTTLLTIIVIFAFIADFLDGESLEDTAKMILGFDDPESEAYEEKQKQLAKSGKLNKPREPKFYDPLVNGLLFVLTFIFGNLYKGLNKCIRCVDYAMGVEDFEAKLEADRQKRQELHPELVARHRLGSWQDSQNKAVLLQESAFGAELEDVEAEAQDLEDAGDEDFFMDKQEKLERMLVSRGDDYGPPATGFAANRRRGGGGGGGGGYGGVSGSPELEAFLNPERVGIEIAIGDLKASTKAAAKRAAKSLSGLVQATKSQMEAELKKLAADWPVVTPRGRHLTERFVAAESTLANVRESLQEAAKGVFEVQRELRGIAFLSGAEMDNTGNGEGRARPSDAAEWKALVAEMVTTTKGTAHALRVLQKVLDSMPGDDDMTNVLRATPQHHPHRQLITELGIAAGGAAASLRGLLTIAVAAGAPSECAPWSKHSQMQIDMQNMLLQKKRKEEDATDDSDSSRSSHSDRRWSIARAIGGGPRGALDARLNAVANDRGNRGDTALTLLGGIAPLSDRSSGPPSSQRISARHRVAIKDRLAAARERRAASGRASPLPTIQDPLYESGDSPRSNASSLSPTKRSPETRRSPGMSPKERLAAARERRAAARTRLAVNATRSKQGMPTPANLPTPGHFKGPGSDDGDSESLGSSAIQRL